MRRRRKLHAKHPRRPVNKAASATVAHFEAVQEPAPKIDRPARPDRAPTPPPPPSSGGTGASRRHAPTQRINTQSWFRIENSASVGTVAVYIYDEIGMWGVNASEFMDELRQIGGNRIELHLNSPGGDVFDGIAIYNCLRSHAARVDVVVDSLAASAASVIAQAGDTITMMPGSQMMIHEAAGLCIGNAEDMAEMAKMLDQQSDNIAGIYAQAAGGDRSEWRTRMKAETWYMAEEAVAVGLADRVHVDEEATEEAPRAIAQVRNTAVPVPPPVDEPDPEPLVIDFAAAFAPPPEPEPLTWDWTAVRGGITALMESAPAPRTQPMPPPAPPEEPKIKFDRAAFRNALRGGTLTCS